MLAVRKFSFLQKASTQTWTSWQWFINHWEHYKRFILFGQLVSFFLYSSLIPPSLKWPFFLFCHLMNEDNLAQISHQIAAISFWKSVPSLQLPSWVLAGWFLVLSMWHSPAIADLGGWWPMEVIARLLHGGHWWPCCWHLYVAHEHENKNDWASPGQIPESSCKAPPSLQWPDMIPFVFINTNRWLLCSCPELWPTNGTAVPAGSLADVAEPLPGTGPLSTCEPLAAHQAGVRCEGDGKTSHAAYKNNYSSVHLVQAWGDLHMESNDFKAVVAGLWAVLHRCT